MRLKKNVVLKTLERSKKNRISLILVIAALILGVEIGFSYGFDKSIYEDSS